MAGPSSGSPPVVDAAGPAADTGATIAIRFPEPTGFQRTSYEATTFGSYLRQLPLKPPGTAVLLYNGDLKWNQRAHAAVVDMSVGTKDLQQCADATMRLRAEYLFASGKQDDIAFNFTSGFRAEWKRWRAGERIKVNGNKCSWTYGGEADASHEQLLKFLTMVFTYAGTLSLDRELVNPPTSGPEIGDVFIQGGSPGHAVIVVDEVEDGSGRKAFLLAQSYMPAQVIHVLLNQKHPELGAWFIFDGDDKLYTPEWTFEWGDRKRWP
ncbi:MAG: DUF4846 domain-containing protein [Flavobacteriales bacterium]|nr:MAG: DUF4846 domain-containing protein [Flavobacteriales bacterium]